VRWAARVRLLNTGQVNKNDPNDARSVAVAALRASKLRDVAGEDHTAVLKLWARRYRNLGSLRTQLVCRLHACCVSSSPAGSPAESQRHKRFRSSTDSPCAVRSPAHGSNSPNDLVADLRRIDEQRRELKRRLAHVVAAAKTTTTEIHGVGPVVAATVLGLVGDITRFPNRDRFAAYHGTAPIEVSSGHHQIYRLSRRGNPQLNHAIHVAAVTQIRNHGTTGRIYYDRKIAEGMGRQSRAPLTQTQDQRRHLQPDDHRRAPHCKPERQGPGRANGEPRCTQRGRLAPQNASSSDKPLPGHRQPYDRAHPDAAASSNPQVTTRLSM
jgi:transposase